MQRRVDRFAPVRLQILQHQVEQPQPRLKRLPIVDQPQPRVQIAVMPKPPLQVFRPELDLLENGRIRLEPDQRPIRFLGQFPFLLALQLALLEGRFHEFTAPVAAHHELAREGVDRLGAHAVQPHAELKHLVVVLGPGVDGRDAVDHLAQRNAPAKIADRDAAALDLDLDLATVAHDEFVDGVVDHLLEQDVATIVIVRAIADPPDIHPRPQPDVLERGKRLDLALVVVVLRVFRHKFEPPNIGSIAPLANPEIDRRTEFWRPFLSHPKTLNWRKSRRRGAWVGGNFGEAAIFRRHGPEGSQPGPGHFRTDRRALVDVFENLALSGNPGAPRTSPRLILLVGFGGGS